MGRALLLPRAAVAPSAAVPAVLIDRAAFGLLLLLMVWLPLPLASNRVPSTVLLLLAFVAVVMAGAWAAVRLPVAAGAPSGSGESTNSSPPGTRAWRLARGGVGLAVLAPVLVAAWQLSAGATADGHATRLHLHRSLLYALAFVAVLLLGRTPQRLVALLGACFASGVLQAVLAILLFSAGSSYVFQGVVVQQGLRASGTFANPDHLANFLAMTMAAGLGLVLAGWRRATGPAERGWRAPVAAAVNFLLSPRMLVRLLLVLGVIALVLTRSRAGNAAFFIALPLVGLALMLRSREMRKPAAVLVASLLAVDVIVVGQWVGLAKVIDRLERTEMTRSAASAAMVADGSQAHYRAAPPPREESLEQRLQAAHDMVAAVEQQPWVGWGAGTFFTVYPQFRSPQAHYGHQYPHAHSDYVEIAAGLGMPVIAALALAWVATLARCVRLLGDGSSPPVRGLAAGVAMAMLCAFVHGWVDFNLHVTANACTLTVLMAAAWAAPPPAPRAHARRHRSTRTTGKT